jgi:hypothetical protein
VPWVTVAALAVLAGVLASAPLLTAPAGARPAATVATAEAVRPALPDTLRGRSGKLRARFLLPARDGAIPLLRDLFGDSAGRRPGVLAAADSGGPFHFITVRPFSDKVRGRIGGYAIGDFPWERRGTRAGGGRTPAGLVEVTPANADLPVSQHFRLRDFLTHDQARVWPKYLALREPLLDKLELVVDELRGMGVAVGRLRVMSGFRTPQYNAQGVGAGGRVSDSRHQYGDAADVYVTDGGRDWMTDLNRDGRVDLRDARLLASAAERVEAAHPELTGGIGIYPATSAHGPFVHIDVRGTRARWGAW